MELFCDSFSFYRSSFSQRSYTYLGLRDRSIPLRESNRDPSGYMDWAMLSSNVSIQEFLSHDEIIKMTHNLASGFVVKNGHTKGELKRILWRKSEVWELFLFLLENQIAFADLLVKSGDSFDRGTDCHIYGQAGKCGCSICTGTKEMAKNILSGKIRTGNFSTQHKNSYIL